MVDGRRFGLRRPVGTRGSPGKPRNGRRTGSFRAGAPCCAASIARAPPQASGARLKQTRSRRQKPSPPADPSAGSPRFAIMVIARAAAEGSSSSSLCQSNKRGKHRERRQPPSPCLPSRGTCRSSGCCSTAEARGPRAPLPGLLPYGRGAGPFPVGCCCRAPSLLERLQAEPPPAQDLSGPVQGKSRQEQRQTRMEGEGRRGSEGEGERGRRGRREDREAGKEIEEKRGKEISYGHHGSAAPIPFLRRKGRP